MRLLLAGDLHIGRSSTGLSAAGHDELRAASAWRRLVEAAIDEQAAIVCLSGDVVDRANKLWESIGPLEEGVERLRKHGIRTVAVAGNHDYDVLARLADMMPDGFVLLGRGGEWERLTIEQDGRAALHIDGWSFPADFVTSDPVIEYDLDRDASVPTLGMIHGDLDVADSRYAPLSRERLMAAGPDAWLLGHIHHPALISMPRGWLLYPGSTQALDFGEPGAHGVWMVDVDGRLGTPTMRPLSTVRFDRADVNLTGCATQEDVERAIVSRIRNAASDAVAPVLKHLALRVDLVGRTPLAPQIEEITQHLVDDLALNEQGVSVEINRIRISVLPEVDLESYASANTAPGAVARLLLELDESEPGEEASRLIERARRELMGVDEHRAFSSLPRREISAEVAREYVRDQARALLNKLVEQTP